MEPNFSEDQLKARYKKLVKKYHPDVKNNINNKEKKMKEINKAYKTLQKLKEKQMLLENNNLNLNSPKQIDASKIFGISKKIMVPYFSQKSDLVPEVDDGYVFDDATTTSILMGFKYNKKVLIQGLHGTENPLTLNKYPQD